MPKLLQAAGPLGKAGWAPFQTLLVAQLQFLEPYLRTARLHESVRLLYQARILILDHRSPPPFPTRPLKAGEVPLSPLACL